MSDNNENKYIEKFKKLLGNTKSEKTISIVAIVISVILIPILILNCVLILKSAINPDKVPSIGKLTPLIVLTESMELEILDGDLIITKVTDTEDIEVGDVISYFDPDSKNQSVVTHRVIEKVTDEEGNPAFKTQGDNNDIEDRYPVPAENVIGVWTGFQVHFLGNVMLFMQSTWGLIICIAIPVILYVVYEVVQRRRKDNQSKNDIDALRAELEALKAEKKNEQGEKAEVNPEVKVAADQKANDSEESTTSETEVSSEN